MLIDKVNLNDIVHAAPVYVSGDVGPVGTSVSLGRVSFLPTDAALIIQSNKKAIVPLMIRMKCTVAGASTTSSHVLFAVDAGARYSSGGVQLLASKGMWHELAFGARQNHVANGGFASAASWSVVQDFSIGAGVATYTHATGLGLLVQAHSAMLAPLTPAAQYDLVYTIASPTGAGLLTAGCSGSVVGTAPIGRIVAGVQVADTYVTRAICANSVLETSMVLSATSGAAASFTVDNVLLRPAMSDAFATVGAVTLAAESDPKYFYRTTAREAAAPAWALTDEVIFNFSPYQSSPMVGLFTPTAAGRQTFNFPSLVVPPGGSFIMHLWNVANATTAPAFEIDATWAEFGVYGS
jgi:hypothetical protein